MITRVTIPINQGKALLCYKESKEKTKMWKIIAFLKWLDLYQYWSRMIETEQDKIIEECRRIVASPI